jgi:putative CocE/NonD family hydrolase
LRGPLCCDGTHEPAGPRKQNEVEARKDVLVYSTAALEADTEVTGPVKLNLWATTSAADTDFTAKLVDVMPDGSAYNVTEGILRARYRNSTAKAELPEAGKPYEYTIDLWSTSTVFLKGHRIRLEVSSSNFPRFDRNPNTGKTLADSTEFVKATNTVLHDKTHPSALILPVVKR